ncbi:MAG TPA: ferrous iron transporter B [Candidatus Avoscillospira avistercoris]|uniref:Fe(2+) transporter FeoB n=1 Tax=Candidatus Avoscillospira avistercoris TaxID=2840707 RepID=A0A9D1FBD4_9FIRM|nr:ferrous iron transporter B [Candidatus Avoscillospira avistercoris]
MRIALAGNPNSGKTTMYNALTGRNEKVGNWAGVTVDKKESPIKSQYRRSGQELIAVDLPGAYSMSPFTSEESITSSYVKNEHPDAIINIVDATNLSRSLFFTTQLLELGIPLVVALNKSDINSKKETKIDVETLAQRLGCPVVETVSTTADGLLDLVTVAASLAGKKQKAPYSQGNVDLTDKHAVEQADRQRFTFVNGIVKDVETRKVLTRQKNSQDKIDNILTNRWLGIPIFAVVMFLVFQISQAWVGPWIAGILGGWIESFQGWVGSLVENSSPLLQSLLVDGIIGGVGAVIGFLPLVMVMYFLIALLEDCGYMARVSVVLDPIFKKVGLSGKSVIPFVIGTGCAIPGVMACRTIRNERERKATAMLTPFMPCGAKLPVIALFAGVFFADASWVGTLMYFMGIVLIFLGALLVNRISGYRSRKSFFIMELPEYKAPSLKRAALAMLSRGWAYIVKAGTIILLCNTAVQLMQSFNWSFQLVEEGMEHTSILASIATPVSVLLIPLGFGAWQLAAAAVTGFIAKENVVGTLAVCYGVTNFIDTDALELTGGASEVAAIFALTKAAALAYLMFNLFTPPCFAAMGAMRSEIKDRKWLWAGIGLQFATGYTVAFLVYQIGTLVTTGSLGTGFVPGLIVVAAIAAFLVYRIRVADKSLQTTYSLSGARA